MELLLRENEINDGYLTLHVCALNCELHRVLDWIDKCHLKNILLEHLESGNLIERKIILERPLEKFLHRRRGLCRLAHLALLRSLVVWVVGC